MLLLCFFFAVTCFPNVSASPFFEAASWPFVQSEQDSSLPGLLYISHGEVHEDMVYHLHTPKTAGVSFFGDAGLILTGGSEHQPPRSLYSIEGCYEWAHVLNMSSLQGRIKATAVMVRSPRAHVLSQYLSCASEDRPPEVRVVVPATFEAWIRGWMVLAEQGKHVGDFLPGARAWAPFAESLLPFGCYSPINLQSHHLSCVKPFLYETRGTAVELAIKNMRDSWFVGLVERYEVSLCLLYAKARGFLPSWCDCEHAGDLSMPYGLHNNDRIQPRPDEVRRQILSTDLNNYSAELLYRAAEQRFLCEVREVEARHGVKILCTGEQPTKC
eukprot:gnl/TRDRNA2_/TRDRNA2_138287_c0_seq2.p1 gnl/TRDRNA2_/TRDRNA2_138287_c0~~gnl/TRDRNA2_/TRDRNA2_138287_c0_seq2.p1  ORF type:complete len:328 (-),score=30.73 gnl/TRDRNA2_/TRDRNA2_138287_c0_seq2:66-1049(-)